MRTGVSRTRPSGAPPNSRRWLDECSKALLGGDEFAVLLPDTDVFSAPRIAKRVIEVLEAPIQLEHEQVTIGASIGIAVHPTHADDAATLTAKPR
jgi:GGDEF domain-containing protein